MDDVQFIRVTTDDLSQQLWAVAAQRDQAVDRLLDTLPMGWTACLLDQGFLQQILAISTMAPGEVRKLDGTTPAAA